MEIAYPFKIYKNTSNDMSLSRNEPIIHLNTLAQICFRASSHVPDFPRPQLLILDHQAVEGVSESGRFEMDFYHNYLKKIDDINDEFLDDNDFRLGLIHESLILKKQEEAIIETYQNAILLHGELRVQLKKKKVGSVETIIQWITE